MPITLFLAGDVMTGRGIDQIMPVPSDPELFESCVRDARVYVTIAERKNGPIPRSVAPAYIWGDALTELERARPDARIVNLETSVTVSGAPWPGKGIHYRMHPANVGCLTAAPLDCCTLANNHVLDWRREGLTETLATLHRAGIATAGAGANAAEAAAPARLAAGGPGAVLVFAFGAETSGIPASWAAGPRRSGVNFLPELSAAAADRAATLIERARRPGDVVVVSIHWGGNWGYEIPSAERDFAHGLVDRGAADVVHGHSSHHAKGIEVYRGRPILYGCGDFLDDYEGISGYEAYRSDLSLMYFVSLGASGALERLWIVPLRMKRFALHRAGNADAEWVRRMLEREGRALGTRAERGSDGSIDIRWS